MMAHILISFLGKTQQGGYDRVIYDFEGAQRRESTVFPLVLGEHLCPDRLLLLGTSGSMWDALQFDNPATSLPLTTQDRQLFSQVRREVSKDRINEAQLAGLSAFLSPRLHRECICRLIPYGRDLDEQVRILEIMASQVGEGDTVSLDITHGLRHLPMLAQLSALYLRSARQVEVAGIYYGARDMANDDGKGHEIAPVIDLKGLLHIADWSAALYAYDKDGDYGIFADLLQRGSLGAHVAHLREAAFLERTNRPRGAHEKLTTFLQNVDKGDLQGIIGLFWPILESRLEWYHQDLAHQRQAALARINLKHGDFIRSVLFAFEGFITRLMEEQGKGDEIDVREKRNKTKRDYENHHSSDPAFRKYDELKKLRNNLAHTYTDDEQVEPSVLANADSLTRHLEELLTRLFPPASK